MGGRRRSVPPSRRMTSTFSRTCIAVIRPPSNADERAVWLARGCEACWIGLQRAGGLQRLLLVARERDHPERPAEGQDEEPDPGEQECRAHHHREHGDALGEEG